MTAKMMGGGSRVVLDDGGVDRITEAQRERDPQLTRRCSLVVFTERVASAIIRIISARRATKRERRAYAEGD